MVTNHICLNCGYSWEIINEYHTVPICPKCKSQYVRSLESKNNNERNTRRLLRRSDWNHEKLLQNQYVVPWQIDID